MSHASPSGGIAQKLHACTESPAAGHANDRFRDLIDLILLGDLVEEKARPAVREACEEIFELREMHAWPPSIVVFDGWQDPYSALAQELRFPIVDVFEAAAVVQKMVDALDASRP